MDDNAVLNIYHRYIATTYMQAYQSGNQLGIQYWFYYPYHDDPGNDPHQHDWWYFWVVYDMSDKKPTKAIYDFHHNVRDVPWNQIQTEGATAGTTGFHPVVFVEAGGHRHLWGVGNHDTSSADYGGGKIRAKNINLDPTIDIMIAYLSDGNTIPFTIDVSKFGILWFDMTYSVAWQIDWLTDAKSFKDQMAEAHPGSSELASWRASYDGFHTDGNPIGDTSNFRLNVERDMGDRWVWIATGELKLDRYHRLFK